MQKKTREGRQFSSCWKHWVGAAVAMAWFSCQGSVLGTLPGQAVTGTGSGAPSPSAPVTPIDPVVGSDGKQKCVPTGDQVGTAPMRRLNKDEYVASLKLVALDAEPVRRFLPVDELPGLLSTNPFSGNVSGQVSRPDLEGYLDAAEALTTSLDMAKYFACDVAQESCIAQSVEKFGKRLLRRAVDGSEKESLLAQWRTLKAKPQDGARLALQSLLVMPSFLYRPEIGIGASEVRSLSPYELATRLAFFATGAAPDSSLMEAAENGMLQTPEGIRAAFQNLTASPAGEYQRRRFYGEWTGVKGLAANEKDLGVFPQFTAPVRAALQNETLDFFESVHRKKEPAAALLTSQRAFVSAQTASYYGVQSSSTASEEVTLPSASNRRGFLTLPGVLAYTGHAPNHGSPIFRGKFVRFNVLCQEVAPPGKDIEVVLPPTQPGMTTRERYDLLMQNKTCKGCHLSMNPLGYAFLKFNGVGEAMELDANKAIDDSGEIFGAEETVLEGVFKGPLELSDKLSKSETFHDCVATQWLQFIVARPLEPAERCTALSIGQKLKAGADIGEAAENLVLTDAFQKVRVAQ
jgi:hypothetical protein